MQHECDHAAVAVLNRERFGRDVEFEITMIRSATSDEIEMNDWFDERLAQEAEFQAKKAGANR